MSTATALEAVLATRPVHPVVLLFSAPACARCPPVKRTLVDLNREYQFQSFGVDAHAPESAELCEQFDVTTLPAVVVIKGDLEDYCVTLHRATADTVRDTIRHACLPILSLTEDF